MKRNDKLFYVLVIVTFLVISYLLTQKVFQNDTFYTIKVGESIFKNGVDMKDHFSFIPDLIYTYPHWLFDSFIYLLYSLGGFKLIYLSIIVLGFILLFTIYNSSVKLGYNKYVSFLFIIFSSVFLDGYFTARAQMFSYIFFVLTIYSLIMLRKTDKKRYFVYLFLSSLMVANMHAAVWPFVLVLFLPFIAQDIITIIDNKFNFNILKTFNIEIEKVCLKKTLIAFALCVLTGFLTPNFLVPFTYFINTMRGISMNYINEHSPITISDYSYVFIFLFLTLVLLLNKKVKIKLWELFLILGLYILAFSSIKNISLLLLLSTFPYIRLLSSFNYKSIEPYLWSNIIVCIIFVLFIIAAVVGYNDNSKKDYVKESAYPIKAVKYIKENIDYKNKRIYNQYDFGSYLLFNDIPVFIDSRADLYLKEFNSNCTVFEDYFDSKYNYDLYINNYNFSYMLLKNTTSFNATIKRYENYKVLYKDEYFTLYDLGD